MTISINNLAQAIYESSYKKEGEKLDMIIKNSVKLLSKKHLLSKSKELLDKLEEIIDKDKGIIRVKISSKKQIRKEMTDEVEKFIEKRYKVKNIITNLEINPKLLGGVKIEIKDEVIDMTLKNKIYKLKNYLLNN